MDNRARAITLGVLTLVFIVVVAFLVFRLQQNQAPEDTGAAGLDSVGAALSAFTCESYLDDAKLNAAGLSTLSASGPLTVTLPLSGDMASNCEYGFAGNQKIKFTVTAYGGTETRLSVLEAYRRANQVITTGHNTDTVGRLRYAYGSSENTCTTNMFSLTNEFEVATLTYEGFDCEETKETNKRLAPIFISKISTVI